MTRIKYDGRFNWGFEAWVYIWLSVLPLLVAWLALLFVLNKITTSFYHLQPTSPILSVYSASFSMTAEPLPVTNDLILHTVHYHFFCGRVTRLMSSQEKNYIFLFALVSHSICLFCSLLLTLLSWIEFQLIRVGFPLLNSVNDLKLYAAEQIKRNDLTYYEKKLRHVFTLRYH